RGVDHDVHARKGARQPIAVAHVPEMETDARVGDTLRHLELLQLVPAEDDDLLGRALAQRDLDELAPKRARPARHQDNFVTQRHAASPSSPWVIQSCARPPAGTSAWWRTPARNGLGFDDRGVSPGRWKSAHRDGASRFGDQT